MSFELALNENCCCKDAIKNFVLALMSSMTDEVSLGLILKKAKEFGISFENLTYEDVSTKDLEKLRDICEVYLDTQELFNDFLSELGIEHLYLSKDFSKLHWVVVPRDKFLEFSANINTIVSCIERDSILTPFVVPKRKKDIKK